MNEEAGRDNNVHDGAECPVDSVSTDEVVEALE